MIIVMYCQFLVLRVEKQYRNIVLTGTAPTWKPMTQSSEYRGFVLRLTLDVWGSAVNETAVLVTFAGVLRKP